MNIERKVIIASLMDTTLIDTLIGKTNPNYFTDNLAKKAYAWILERYKNNKEITPTRAALDLKEDILKMSEETVIVEDYNDMINILHAGYTKRKIQNSISMLHKLTTSNLDAEEIQNKAQEIIFNATQESVKIDKTSLLSDALMKSYQSFIERQNNEGAKGLPTFFPKLDGLIGGLTKGHVTVIAGLTSMGKTAFAVNLIRNWIERSIKSLIMSLEMNDISLTDRLVVLESGVPGRDFNTNILNEPQKKNINSAYDKLDKYGKNLIIDYQRGLTVEDIKAKIRKHYRENKFDVVIIDYLQRIKLTGSMNTNKEVGVIVNSIRDLAGELDVPILLLCQLSRGAAEKGTPKLKHLRDSGEIEESADEVWFVHRDDYHKEVENQNPVRQDAKLILAKGRTTGVGVVNFVWYPEIGKWNDSFIDDQQEVFILRNKR